MKWKGRGRKPLWYLSGEAEETHGNNLFHERTLRDLDSKPGNSRLGRLPWTLAREAEINEAV